jgi:hypothetical protein
MARCDRVVESVPLFDALTVLRDVEPLAFLVFGHAQSDRHVISLLASAPVSSAPTMPPTQCTPKASSESS